MQDDDNELTDKERLVALLKSFGLRECEADKHERPPSGGYSFVRGGDTVVIGSGEAGGPAVCEFTFYPDGEFWVHGCWED